MNEAVGANGRKQLADEEKPMANRHHLDDTVGTKIRSASFDNSITSSRTWMEVRDVMSRNVAAILPNETLVSVAKIMSEKHISCVAIVDNSSIIGILTERDVLKKAVAEGKDFRKISAAALMSAPVVSVSPDLSVLAASKIMEAKNIKRLPVLANEQLAGIVTQTDLVRALTHYGMWMDISKIMSEDVSGIQSNATVAEAAKVMASRNISSIAVMAGDEVVGILTERDVLKRVVALRRDPHQTKIGQVMSSPVTTVPANHSICSASKTMEDENIRRLIVMEGRKLCGIITQTDIFMAVKSKLQAEEDKNLQLLEESESCIFTTDLDGITTYVNPAFAELFAVSDPGEFIGQPFLPEQFWSNPGERQQLLRDTKKGNFQNKELTLRTAKGKKIYVTLFSSFTKDSRGRINGSQGVVSDITEKKELVALREAEEELQESEKRVKAILDTVHTGITLIDAETHKIVDVNPAAVQMIGVPREQIVGKVCHQFICPAEVGSCPITDLGQKTGTLESVLLTARGRKMPILKTISSITLDGHNHLLYSFVDLTERKEAEKAMEKLNRSLESTVRKLELTNKELQEFTYVAAHDLKTPLRAIGVLAHWISTDYADKFDEQGQEQVKLLVERAERMSKLVDSLLEYSRTGQPSQKQEEVDLNAVLSEVIGVIDPPEDIEITVENDLPTLICDRTRMIQVFGNLLNNAVKYADKPKGRIRVGCVEQDGFWRFSVADNGPGIEQKYFGKIFKIFQTLSPRDGAGGTGIGLSIVKKIVELNRGRVWLESNPGEGSTFFFTLPK
jgi:two-component system sensor kinase FixL